MIIQAIIILKSKYTYILLRQLHIINKKTTNPILPKVYLANILVNSWKLFYLFYKMDLLFEYQNGKFK